MDITKLNKKKYGGKYIATGSFTSMQIIAYGKNAAYVYRRAIEKGYNEPVINFVPDEGVICMY